MDLNQKPDDFRLATNNMTAQKRFDIEVMLGKLIMHHKVKDLVRESIALNKITDLESVPLQCYIDVICKTDKNARNASYDMDSVISNSEDMIQALKEESDIQSITEDCFYEKLCDVFNFYFIDKQFLKYTNNDKTDENGLPDYFPLHMKTFIKTSYLTFKSIRNTQESSDFADILTATPNQMSYNWSYPNRASILTMTFLGKIRCGRDITRLLFERIPKSINIPDSFKKLCHVKNGKYIIFNTDYNSLDFQLAVFDLIAFVDSGNKVLFNNKINQFLK